MGLSSLAQSPVLNDMSGFNMGEPTHEWVPGRGFISPRGIDLPPLPDPWEWRVRVEGFWAACLFTQGVDCIVEVDGSSVKISTGVAPLEVVEAVLKANSRKP